MECENVRSKAVEINKKGQGQEFFEGWSFNLSNTFLVMCNVQNIAIEVRCE